MNKVQSVLFVAGISLALGLTFSCSNDGDGSGEQSYDYCITANKSCLAGPFTASTCTGQVSNSCPDGSTPSVGSSSSGGGISLRSSSGGASLPSSSGTSSQSIGVSSNSGGNNKCNSIANCKKQVIGNQVWMAENLNIDVSGSTCYEGKSANCDKYGRLYDWATAMSLDADCNSSFSSCASQITTPHQGICPSGWHIPSNDDWDELLLYVDSENGGSGDYDYYDSAYYSYMAGRYLKATSGWNSFNGRSGNGQDTYGFSALPGGGGYPSGSFTNVGYEGYWWSANEGSSFSAYFWSMYHDDEYVGYGSSGKDALQSVRCVKD